MATLCTMPGRHGDLLWSLPTVRALAERDGASVDLLISEKYGSLHPLLDAQPYIGEVWVDDRWDVQETAPMTPRVPPGDWPIGHDRIVHLGYESWPAPNLPQDIARRAGVEIDLRRPWITAKPLPDAQHDPYPVVAGWSDEWFELKVGVTYLVADHTLRPFPVLVAEDSRWARETHGPAIGTTASGWITDWLAAASFIRSAQVFLGCCSALHVLAVALGIPAVVMEPNPHRHHPIFWPLGMDGPEVTIVRGGDGHPTFDARHTRETIDRVRARGGR